MIAAENSNTCLPFSNHQFCQNGMILIDSRRVYRTQPNVYDGAFKQKLKLFEACNYFRKKITSWMLEDYSEAATRGVL